MPASLPPQEQLEKRNPLSNSGGGFLVGVWQFPEAGSLGTTWALGTISLGRRGFFLGHPAESLSGAARATLRAADPGAGHIDGPRLRNFAEHEGCLEAHRLADHQGTDSLT